MQGLVERIGAILNCLKVRFDIDLGRGEWCQLNFRSGQQMKIQVVSVEYKFHTCLSVDHALDILKYLRININKPLLRSGMLIPFTLIYAEVL